MRKPTGDVQQLLSGQSCLGLANFFPRRVSGNCWDYFKSPNFIMINTWNMLNQHKLELEQLIANHNMPLTDFVISDSKTKNVTFIFHKASTLRFEIFVGKYNFYLYKFNVEAFRSHTVKVKKKFSGFFLFPYKFDVVKKSFAVWLCDDISVFNVHKQLSDTWVPPTTHETATEAKFTEPEKRAVSAGLDQIIRELSSKMTYNVDQMSEVKSQLNDLKAKLDSTTKGQWLVDLKNFAMSVGINLVFDASQGQWLWQRLISLF